MFYTWKETGWNYNLNLISFQIHTLQIIWHCCHQIPDMWKTKCSISDLWQCSSESFLLWSKPSSFETRTKEVPTVSTSPRWISHTPRKVPDFLILVSTCLHVMLFIVYLLKCKPFTKRGQNKILIFRVAISVKKYAQKNMSSTTRLPFNLFQFNHAFQLFA